MGGDLMTGGEQVTNRVDMSSPTANMFGIEPCPKCKSPYRYMPVQADGRLIIRCDDCGFEEPVQEEESK